MTAQCSRINIKVTTDYGKQVTSVVTLKNAQQPHNGMVVFEEDLLRKVSRALDLKIALRDWKLRISGLETSIDTGSRSSERRIKVLGVVDGIKYDLLRALLALGYSSSTPTPIHPVIYIEDEEKGTIEEYIAVTIDWRRYLKCKDVAMLDSDQAMGVSTATHLIHIPTKEFQRIGKVCQDRIIDCIKAAMEPSIQLDDFFTVTTTNHRDQLIVLSMKEYDGILSVEENEYIQRLVDNGLTVEEARTARELYVQMRCANTASDSQ
jgi:hypothetical protein